ncbi:TPA: hypothetical protein HA242_07280 [Candidatus Woesearchaeota archaeon]|nr:hypothetical protein [Candidatus Woesearchaeota archaeon]
MAIKDWQERVFWLVMILYFLAIFWDFKSCGRYSLQVAIFFLILAMVQLIVLVATNIKEVKKWKI